MKKRGLFWDNDGVLVDTEALYFQACADTLASVGIQLSRNDFIEISLARGESVFSLAREIASEDELRRIRNNRYEALLESRNLVLPGVEEALKTLHGKVRMAIVTSCRRRHFDIIHKRSRLLHYFDFVLTREDYRHSKPHPEPYLTALDESGLDAAECLVIEDSPRGLLSATRAGLHCLVIPGDLTAGGDFSGARRILAGIHEVPAIVLRDDLDDSKKNLLEFFQSWG